TEGNYLVFRGRVSGITDEGRVFFLPYAQIDFLQINRQVKEVEIRRLFGELIDDQVGRPASATGSGTFPSASTQSGSSANLTNRPANAPMTADTPAVAGPLRSSAQG